jgi:hypothetical protein
VLNSASRNLAQKLVCWKKANGSSAVTPSSKAVTHGARPISTLNSACISIVLRSYIKTPTRECTRTVRNEGPDPAQLHCPVVEANPHLASVGSLKIPCHYNSWTLAQIVGDWLSNKEFHDRLTSLTQYGWGQPCLQTHAKQCPIEVCCKTIPVKPSGDIYVDAGATHLDGENLHQVIADTRTLNCFE